MKPQSAVASKSANSYFDGSSSGSQIFLRGLLGKSLLTILIFCFMQTLSTADPFAADSDAIAAGAIPERTTPAPEESFALSSLGQRSSQSEPSLLIGMIDHEAISDTRRSATSAAQPTDGSDSASINSSVVSSQVAKQSAFRSDSLAAFFRRTPHYGFLSWQDLRSLVRTPTFPADKHYIVFAPDTQAEADVNAPEQPQTHFRPLAEIQFGDYSLPVYLGVRDAEHCCQ